MKNMFCLGIFLGFLLGLSSQAQQLPASEQKQPESHWDNATLLEKAQLVDSLLQLEHVTWGKKPKVRLEALNSGSKVYYGKTLNSESCQFRSGDVGQVVDAKFAFVSVLFKDGDNDCYLNFPLNGNTKERLTHPTRLEPVDSYGGEQNEYFVLVLADAPPNPLHTKPCPEEQSCFVARKIPLELRLDLAPSLLPPFKGSFGSLAILGGSHNDRLQCDN